MDAESRGEGKKKQRVTDPKERKKDLPHTQGHPPTKREANGETISVGGSKAKGTT